MVPAKSLLISKVSTALPPFRVSMLVNPLTYTSPPIPLSVIVLPVVAIAQVDAASRPVSELPPSPPSIVPITPSAAIVKSSFSDPPVTCSVSEKRILVPELFCRLPPLSALIVQTLVLSESKPTTVSESVPPLPPTKVAVTLSASTFKVSLPSLPAIDPVTFAPILKVSSAVPPSRCSTLLKATRRVARSLSA